ncbi:MAG: ABC transporter permease subunit, partial [Planctomycetes bacterium]|nr:ABC transporter permease subunit [Planctomycetota bacterium]
MPLYHGRVMLLGPIFQVEMVSTARRKRYFALRVLYAGLILLVMWWSYEETRFPSSYGNSEMSIKDGTMLATTFFVSFSWLQMLTILTVGPALAVGTIAEERERRTIEYLFATDLANHEIVLGKTVARLLLLGKLVLVGLPILFLFRLLGGIPTKLLLTTFLLAGSSAVMITALSLCVSVWSSRARDATVRVYLLLAALFFLPMILEAFSRFAVGVIPLWQTVVA